MLDSMDENKNGMSSMQGKTPSLLMKKNSISLT
jgi:hypothetical protein